MKEKQQARLSEAVGALRRELGDNLHSCCLFGSAVRGNLIEGVSDLNVLIVLERSDSAAHQAVGRALKDFAEVDPFVLGRPGFQRSARAFASKFASIKRNYRVLHGADVLADLKVDTQLEKFLCEQAVRNLRLRLVYAFVTRSRDKAYEKFITRNLTAIFVHLSEALGLEGISAPTDFEARIPVLEREFKIDGAVLRDILELKKHSRDLSDAEEVAWHDRLFPLLDAATSWIESKWAQSQ